MKLTTPRFDKAQVLVIGDVMLDRYWHGGTSRISPEAPVPVVKVNQVEDRPGGAGNVATIFNAMVDAMARRGVEGRAVSPWYFPTPEDYRARLEAAGFEVEAIELIPRPTVLPGKMEAWLETFGEAFLHAMPEEDRPAILAEITEAVRPALFEPEGRWVADYVRLRFRARKPEAA